VCIYLSEMCCAYKLIIEQTHEVAVVFSRATVCNPLIDNPLHGLKHDTSGCNMQNTLPVYLIYVA
jgi:hypothetical protein